MAKIVSDISQAAEFLEALAGDSVLAESATPHTFQTVDDNADRKSPNLRRIIHGKISDCAEELTQLNQGGAGIFAMINAGDGKGRRSENTTAVRALFIDDDENKVRAISLHLPPSLVVKSARGLHFYWLVFNCEINEFSNSQKRLATHYGTDALIHDLPRVMRVPGFYHQKIKDGQSNGPVMVTLEEARTDRVYALGDIVNKLSPLPLPDMPRWVQRYGSEPSDAKFRCRRYLAHVPPAVDGAGGEDATYKAACIVAVDFGLNDSDAFDCLAEWNQRCSPPWGPEELEAKIKHARKYATKPVGNKLNRIGAMDNGRRSEV